MWNAVFLVVSLSISTVFCIKPSIVDEIYPEVKQQHDVGYLNCTVINTEQDSKPNVVQWSKNKGSDGSPLILSEDDKIILQQSEEYTLESGLKKYDIFKKRDDDRITYTLVVRQLSETDSGKYTCTIVMTGLTWENFISKMGDLTVLVPPKVTPGGANEYELDVGADLGLSCSSSGYPSPNITWKREDGNPLQNGAFQYTGGSLQLYDLQFSDRGNYICVADNNVKPPDNYKVRVNLFFSPICFAVQDTVGQAQNRRFQAKLECITTGYPTPDTMWYKLTKEGIIPIIDDDKYDITKLHSQLKSDQMWYTLTVKNVQANDYTEYYCVAKNRFGEGSVAVILFETFECQGPNCPSFGTGAAPRHVSSYISFALVFAMVSFIKRCFY